MAEQDTNTGAASSETTDAQLATLWDGSDFVAPGDGDKEKTPEPKKEEVKVEGEGEPQGKDRAQFGRRTKLIEENLLAQQQTLQSILNRLDTFGQTQPTQNAPVPVMEGQDSEEQFVMQYINAAKTRGTLPEFVATPEDQFKTQHVIDAARKQYTRVYQDGYVRTLNTLKVENPDQHDVIVKEMMENFNIRRTGNPAVDAEINYSRALAAVAKKGMTKKAAFKGEEAIGTGVDVVGKDPGGVGVDIIKNILRDTSVGGHVVVNDKAVVIGH